MGEVEPLVEQALRLDPRGRHQLAPRHPTELAQRERRHPQDGRAVQLAVSRSRESLADVSAVELTRNPLGLARALQRISADPDVLEVANRATQHLYIVNPIKSFEKRASGLWETHPPVSERIRNLERIAGQMGLPEAGGPGGA